MDELKLLINNWRIYIYMLINALSAIAFLVVPFYFVKASMYEACNTRGLNIEQIERLRNHWHYRDLRHTTGGITFVCFGFQFRMFSFSSYLYDDGIFEDIKVKIRCANRAYFNYFRTIFYDRFF